jgi:hypothetical protein
MKRLESDLATPFKSDLSGLVLSNLLSHGLELISPLELKSSPALLTISLALIGFAGALLSIGLEIICAFELTSSLALLTSSLALLSDAGALLCIGLEIISGLELKSSLALLTSSLALIGFMSDAGALLLERTSLGRIGLDHERLERYARCGLERSCGNLSVAAVAGWRHFTCSRKLLFTLGRHSVGLQMLFVRGCHTTNTSHRISSRRTGRGRQVLGAPRLARWRQYSISGDGGGDDHETLVCQMGKVRGRGMDEWRDHRGQVEGRRVEGGGERTTGAAAHKVDFECVVLPGLQICRGQRQSTFSAAAAAVGLVPRWPGPRLHFASGDFLHQLLPLSRYIKVRTVPARSLRWRAWLGREPRV